MQVLQILPDSALYGRHLLKEGDYITSINGKSLDRLSRTECDELLGSPSTVICIELLRMINCKTSSNICTGPESISETPEMKIPVVEDDWLDRRHVGRTLTGKQAPDATRLITHGRDPLHDYVSRSSYIHVEEKSPKHGAEKLGLLDQVQVFRKNLSANESRNEPEVVKNLLTTPVNNSHSILDRQTTRHSKGVRFKLSTEYVNVKEANGEETTQKKCSSADRQLVQRHKVTATPMRNAKSLPDLTEQISCPGTVSQRSGTTWSVVLANGDHKDSGSLNRMNHTIKPGTSVVVKQEEDRSLCYDAVNSLTGFSPHKCTADEGLDQEFLVPPNALTLKIYTSVINIDSSGNVVLTTRVTPSNYQPLLPRWRTVSISRPFQISVSQGLTGLGIEVTEQPAGMIITGIVDTGPVGKNGNVR